MRRSDATCSTIPAAIPATEGDLIRLTETTQQDGGRGFQPGPRAFRLAATGAVALAAAVAAGTWLALAATAGRPADRYGQLPSWLPKAKIPVGRIVTASAARPALAIQGDTVAVEVGHARVLTTAVGPQVPEEGRFPVPETTPCAFTVTFAAATSAIPLARDAFTIVDELGRLHHPKVTAQDGGAPPERIRPGQSFSVTVSGTLPTGGGRLRWSPGGTKPIVSWDFDVEID